MSWVVMSPHLDDAVLSLGAWIAAQIRSGEEVKVATVFSEGGAGHARRRREDEAALEALGASAIHLGYLDAPFRSGFYTTFARITSGWREEEDRLIEEVRDSIHAIKPAQLVCPLAVGGHVDHRVVHAASLAAAAPDDLLFYEDLPYAWIAGATALRLAELGFAHEQRPLPPLEHVRASFLEEGYVRSYLAPVDCPAVLEDLGKSWATANHRPDCARAEPVALGEITTEDRANQLTAVASYASQLDDLFPPEGRFEPIFTRAEDRPLWRLP